MVTGMAATTTPARTRTTTTTLRAVLYGRISRENGRLKGGTLRSDAMQEDEVTRRAAERNFRVVSWDLDMDVSGGLFKRAGFQRALDIFRNGEADVMIVPALDRFGRDMKVIYKALEIIEDSGAYLMSIKDGIEDSRTEEGRTQIALYGMFAQIQLDRIKAGWINAHVRHVADGIASRVPFGYERGADRRLVPTAAGRRWVPRMFEWRAERVQLATIAERLNSAGVTTRTGRRWRKDAVAVVLANRVYLGEVAYGELVNPEAHPPLVELPVWHAAQVARSPRAKVKERGLLAGLLRCASCRYCMGFKGATGTYQCAGRHAAGRCPAPVSITAAQADAWVREWADRQMAAAVDGLGFATDAQAVAPELTRALEEAKAAVDLFMGDPTREVRLGTERYNAQLDRLLAHEAELEAACAWPSDTPAPQASLDQVWAQSVEEQRVLLRAGIDAVFARGRPGRGVRLPIDGRLHVCPIGTGPKPEDLPRRGDGGVPYVIRPFAFPDEADSVTGAPLGQ